MVGLEGDTVIETSVGGGGGGGGGTTVRVVLPEMPPSVAVIVVAPAANVLARPEELMPAIDVLEEDQLTAEVRLCMDPSL